MLKTPTLRRFEARLAEINDQLCYFSFADAEVEMHLATIPTGDIHSFTIDTFPGNRFSERLHVKTAELTLFREKAFHTSASVSLIAAVESLLGYIKDIESFRAIVSPSQLDQHSEKRPEEQLRKKLMAWLGNEFDSGIIKTIKYLRLRRNHVAHFKEEMSREFKGLIANDANHLRHYWASQPTDIYDFDFSNNDFLVFRENESLALMNLTRVCMRRVDDAVLSSVTAREIARYEFTDFRMRSANKCRSAGSMIRSFHGFLEQKYGDSILVAAEDIMEWTQNS